MKYKSGPRILGVCCCRPSVDEYTNTSNSQSETPTRHKGGKPLPWHGSRKKQNKKTTLKYGHKQTETRFKTRGERERAAPAFGLKKTTMCRNYGNRRPRSVRPIDAVLYVCTALACMGNHFRSMVITAVAVRWMSLSLLKRTDTLAPSACLKQTEGG